MKIVHTQNNKKYYLSNENLHINDKVYPIGQGICKDQDFFFEKFRFELYMSGFPTEPHTIMDLNNDKYKPYQVRTDYGFGPIETYFKIIKIENIKEIEKI